MIIDTDWYTLLYKFMGQMTNYVSSHVSNWNRKPMEMQPSLLSIESQSDDALLLEIE